MAGIITVLNKARWSPYWVGTGIGILSWITFALMNKALGVSTTLVRASGAIEGLVSPLYVNSNAYFSKYLGIATDPKPIFEWQFALVAMLAVGAFCAASLSSTRIQESVPELWEKRFGSSKLKRYTVSFFSGIIIIIGARLAGGCTSGHGISGGLQLAVSSWIFFLCLFLSGAITARILYGKKGKKDA
jgi:uncharacterized protein